MFYKFIMSATTSYFCVRAQHLKLKRLFIILGQSF